MANLQSGIRQAAALCFYLLVVYVENALASMGDNSVVFSNCLDNCVLKNCTAQPQSLGDGVSVEEAVLPFDRHQPLYLKLLGWNCHEECKYECMWSTVDILVQRYQYTVPQFYGKWPFVRIMGIQEPVSALASVLNLLANYYMIQRMRSRLTVKSPLRTLWYLNACVSLNTWFWSIVFHTRDTPFTEKMDYFSAFAFILFQFNAFFVRILKLKRAKRFRHAMYGISAASVVYFIYHVNYLSSVSFDYGYNMRMNILFGALNSLCWITWSVYNMYFKRLRYAWRCAFGVFLFDALMVFEVFDFSPIYWTLDSHAMWHLSTVSIPFVWYQFIIDDDHHLKLSGFIYKS